MKMIILFFIPALFLTSKVHSQKTPADFGNTGFWCFSITVWTVFKTDSLPAGFIRFCKRDGDRGRLLGVPVFLTGIPGSQKFYDKCYQIQHDSPEYKFSWINAKLENWNPWKRPLYSDNMPNKKPVLLTGLNIYFSSKGQIYIPKFGTCINIEASGSRAIMSR
jgi:hypothetical protein